MCIILTIDANTRPAKSEFRALLETCWQNNPDGAGFMYSQGGKVHGYKGFMQPGELFDALRAVPVSCPLVVHFRIATSGGVNAECTHPYPVTNSISRLHSLKWTAPAGIAHNGVIYGMFTDNERGISDTAFYTKTIVSTVKRTVCTRSETLATSTRAARILTETCEGSRLAILDRDGNVKRIGKWDKVQTGVYASNASYRAARAGKAAETLPVWDDFGLPETCEGCTSRGWCETECPFCFNVAESLGYTSDDYVSVYDSDFCEMGNSYYAQ